MARRLEQRRYRLLLQVAGRGIDVGDRLRGDAEVVDSPAVVVVGGFLGLRREPEARLAFAGDAEHAVAVVDGVPAEEPEDVPVPAKVGRVDVQLDVPERCLHFDPPSGNAVSGVG